MKKTPKDLIKAISLIPVVLLSHLILFILLLLILFGSAFVVREVHHYQIRNEVFTYVEEHKDTIEIRHPQHSEYFEYTQ